MLFLRWLMPWRRQKTQTVAPPTPQPETIYIIGIWRIEQALEGDNRQPELGAMFGLTQRLAAETDSTYTLAACYPKAQSVARRTLDIELSGAFGLSLRLAANVQLSYPLTAAFDLATPATAQASDYVLKGEYD